MLKPLSQLNYFFRLAAERKLSGSDQLMYLHIFNKFNQAHWTETLRITDAELKDLMRLYDSTGKPATIETIRRSRQRLKAKGFIEFTSGNGQAPLYKLPCLYPDNTPADTPDYTPDDTPADRLINSSSLHKSKDEDYKTKIKSAGAGEESKESDPADILKVWKAETGCDLRGDRQRWDLWEKADKDFTLTRQAILKAMDTKKTFVLTYEHFQNTYEELKNPVSLKGGESSGRYQESKDPRATWAYSNS